MCNEQIPRRGLSPGECGQRLALLLGRQGRRQGIGPIDVMQLLRCRQPQPQAVQFFAHGLVPPYMKSLP